MLQCVGGKYSLELIKYSRANTEYKEIFPLIFEIKHESLQNTEKALDVAPARESMCEFAFSVRMAQFKGLRVAGAERRKEWLRLVSLQV